MDTAISDFREDLRQPLTAEVAAVAGPYSLRYPANPFDWQTVGFAQSALHKLGHPVSIAAGADRYVAKFKFIELPPQ